MSQMSTNKLISSYLRKLESSSTHKDNIYRTRAFKKARSIINSLGFELKNISQIKGFTGMGKGMLNRIQEILSTGKLSEVDDEIIDDKEKVLEIFLKIYGVGPKTAERWYEKGHRDLKDLIKYERLTNAQKIGINYYDELSQRIPRREIDAIDRILQHTVSQINHQFKINIECVIAGSYRRNLPESGDIDCVIGIRNTKLNDQHIDLLLSSLKNKGLLTDELGRGENKFIGICQDNAGVHRRIDFEFVRDYDCFPYELIYFTGSAEFNVGMRQKAKNKGMMLNQNGLYMGKKLKLIPTKNEEEVFKHLGMNYLNPEDRN